MDCDVIMKFKFLVIHKYSFLVNSYIQIKLLIMLSVQKYREIQEM